MIAFVVLVLQAAAAMKPATYPKDYTVEGWLRRMSLEEKVAQMNYVPIRTIIHDLYTVRPWNPFITTTTTIIMTIIHLKTSRIRPDSPCVV